MKKLAFLETSTCATTFFFFLFFYQKIAKVNAQGLVPIFQRITVNGKRNDKSTGKFIDPDKWHSEISKVKGNSEEARTINSHLNNLKIKVNQAEKIQTINDYNGVPSQSIIY